jgi:pimeloyl-ACP methyl ester carboxylesterase
MSSKSIVFIHGLFMNPASWRSWTDYFGKAGFQCYAPAYAFHEGDPAALRNNIAPGLGKLTLGETVRQLAAFIAALPEKPILVGHSMGGLIVQKLLEMDQAVAAAAIDPAPPQGVFTFQFSFLKANLSTINPLKGDAPCLPSLKWFHYAFCNTLTMAETKLLYDAYVVPESRNIPRSSTGSDGKIDFAKPHHPLLMVAGAEDHIIPPALVTKNCKAYQDAQSITELKIFPARSHILCLQDGWQEIADFIMNWIKVIG